MRRAAPRASPVGIDVLILSPSDNGARAAWIESRSLARGLRVSGSQRDAHWRPGATAAASATDSATATAADSATGSGAAECSASIVESQWNNGFVATVTVNNTGTTATNAWEVTWTWPGNQSIVNSWNAAVTQNGTSATALDMAYDNVIAAGGKTSFGLQASFSGTNSVPALSCQPSNTAAGNGGAAAPQLDQGERRVVRNRW